MVSSSSIVLVEVSLLLILCMNSTENWFFFSQRQPILSQCLSNQLKFLSRLLFQITCNFKFVIYHNILCQHLLLAIWGDSLLVIIWAYHGRNGFLRRQELMVTQNLPYQPVNNVILLWWWRQPHPLGSTTQEAPCSQVCDWQHWVPTGHPPATVSTLPAIFRLLSCPFTDLLKSLVSLCLLHWSERTDNFSKNHSYAPQSFKLSLLQIHLMSSVILTPSNPAA